MLATEAVCQQWFQCACKLAVCPAMVVVFPAMFELYSATVAIDIVYPAMAAVCPAMVTMCLAMAAWLQYISNGSTVSAMVTLCLAMVAVCPLMFAEITLCLFVVEFINAGHCITQGQKMRIYSIARYKFPTNIRSY